MSKHRSVKRADLPNFLAAVAAVSGLTLGTGAQAQDAAASAAPSEAGTLTEAFTKGHVTGNFRTIYFSTHNAFNVRDLNQDTISYGGGLGYVTAPLQGFSAGVSAFVQRGINHSDNPAKRDSNLGPNVLAMGEAYLQYEDKNLKVVAGNQKLELPFAATYDWRMAPRLFQGLTARYGSTDDYVTAFKITRFKPYTANSFTRRTTYNSDIDSFSTIGNQETNGFWGLGGAHKWALNPVTLKGESWYFDYQDYAKMAYVQGEASLDQGEFHPFLGVQGIRETGDGRELLGHVESEVLGTRLGVRHNSMTLSLSYDRIVPHGNSFLNGAPVTPYAHFVASGPLFAQPFLNSTEDLGAGNAYAVDISGAPADGWFVGAGYSFMDLKPSPSAPSLNQSGYLTYAIYNFGGKLKGLSIADFLSLNASPGKARFLQNRVTLEYAFN